MREVSRGWKERLRRKEAAGLDSQQGWIPNRAGTSSFSTCVPASSIPGFVLSLVWALINLSYSRALFISFLLCLYLHFSFPLLLISFPSLLLLEVPCSLCQHSQGSSMGLGTTRQIINHLQSVVKECPSCWWDVRRCHSAFQEKDLPLQDVFGVWFEVHILTAGSRFLCTGVPGELCCSAGAVCTVRIMFDCPIPVQSPKSDWKGWKGLFACTGTIASHNICKETQRVEGTYEICL